MALHPPLPTVGTFSPAAFRGLDIGSTMAHETHGVAARPGVAAGLTATVSGLTVTIAPGSAILTPGSGANGSYRAAVSTATALTLAARDATYSRRDLIVLRVYDADIDSSGRREAALEVVTGTPAASPVTPAAPTGSLALWVAVVPTSGTVTLVDQRVWTSSLGGVITCTSTTRPAGASLRAGQFIYETDTQAVRVWNGSSWFLVQARERTITIGQTMAVTTDVNGYATTSIVYPDGVTPVAAPTAVSFQDAMTNMTLGPIFARWDVAYTTTTSVRCKAFQTNGSALPSYPVRFGVTLTVRVNG